MINEDGGEKKGKSDYLIESESNLFLGGDWDLDRDLEELESELLDTGLGERLNLFLDRPRFSSL